VSKTEFHCFIQQCPPEATEVTRPCEHGVPGPGDSCLEIPESCRGNPLRVSFDDVYAQLQGFPRLFIEPDGSFVWVGTQVQGEWPWKLDGLLQDGGTTLAYLELKGFCSAQELDAILRTLGWPREPIMFQLAREGITLSESAFRARFLSAPASENLLP
jgi:hypothetical protein